MSKTRRRNKRTEAQICSKKVRYKSSATAERKAKELNRRPYWCFRCRGYHLSSKPGLIELP